MDYNTSLIMGNYHYIQPGKYILAIDQNNFVQFKGLLSDQYIGTGCEVLEFDSEAEMENYLFNNPNIEQWKD